MKTDNSNIDDLREVLHWIRNLVTGRLKIHFSQIDDYLVENIAFSEETTGLASFAITHQPTFIEFAVLALSYVPHIQPDFFNKIIAEYLPDGGDFPEFGCVKGTNHRGILPTGETAQFIIAGDDIGKRIAVQRLFSSEHWFAKEHVLWLEQVREGEPAMSGRMIMNPEIVELLTLGTVSKPSFSIDFPAEHIETEMDWDDLVLPETTFRQIQEIEQWIACNETLINDWGMKKRIKPGYRALFYGPPGTGKTLTAMLLGKQTGNEVFRIDLSRVISKYIGETEKNLARLFDKAENKNWILFFDEADALFGKRTDIRDAHDKYANQEVAYLLQRVENYNGLVILASNQRSNIDNAFSRRFQNIIPFPMPRPEERLSIWKKTIPQQLPLDMDLDIENIALRYELSGAAILNIIQYCSIQLLADTAPFLTAEMLDAAVRREYIKEGRIT
ncbi:ATP-binding protein [Chlorobium limicola]